MKPIKCVIKNGDYYCADTGEKCKLGLFVKPYGRVQTYEEARAKNRKET
jgi:hypothetical protein